MVCSADQIIGRRSRAITERRLSLEEFRELPEEKPALELVDGVVRQKVAPRWLHSGLQYGVAERINLSPVLPGFELTVWDLFATLQLD